MTEQQILVKLKEVMTSLSIDYMPTIKELRGFGLSEVERGIYALGGQKKFAEKHGIPMKKANVTWTEDLIKEKILFTMKELKITTFPTSNDFEKVLGNRGIAVKIGKSGGFRAWSEKLDIPLKESDTLFGNEEEDFVFNTLKQKGYSIENMTTNHKYDLLIDNCVRIEVKASHLYHSQNSKYYSFYLGAKYHDCDLFIFVTVDDNGEKSIYIVPSKFLMGKEHISFGLERSKWNEFKDKYDNIDKYINFYKTL